MFSVSVMLTSEGTVYVDFVTKLEVFLVQSQCVL